MTWSQMNTIQRAACVALLVPALAACGALCLMIKACHAVGLE